MCLVAEVLHGDAKHLSASRRTICRKSTSSSKGTLVYTTAVSLSIVYAQSARMLWYACIAVTIDIQSTRMFWYACIMRRVKGELQAEGPWLRGKRHSATNEESDNAPPSASKRDPTRCGASSVFHTIFWGVVNHEQSRGRVDAIQRALLSVACYTRTKTLDFAGWGGGGLEPTATVHS